MIEKRSKLGESQTLQQFSRDVDEIEAWISEKLQTATDESYKDPTNIQVEAEEPAPLLLVGVGGGRSLPSAVAPLKLQPKSNVLLTVLESLLRLLILHCCRLNLSLLSLFLHSCPSCW